VVDVVGWPGTLVSGFDVVVVVVVVVVVDGLPLLHAEARTVSTPTPRAAIQRFDMPGRVVPPPAEIGDRRALGLGLAEPISCCYPMWCCQPWRSSS